jgi:hypothetical protein
MRADILLKRQGTQRLLSKRSRGAFAGLAVLALLALSGAGRAAEGPRRDMESRIQYAYYTVDAPALRNLAQNFPAEEGHDRLRGYYAALLAWRQALLSPQASVAEQFARRCVSEIDATLALQPDSAEALALRSSCAEVPYLSGGHAPLAGYRAHRDLTRALQLSPHNPRVLLLDAMSDYQLPPSAGGNIERALTKLRQAVAAFEAERTGSEHLPGWGGAEAYFYLARDLLDHNDPVAARDALEHALLLAPQFSQARQLMVKITSG